MPQPEKFARCACQHCGGHIEFPAEGAGREITCPHCNWPTVLTIPKTPAVEIGGGPKTQKRIFLACGIAAAVAAIAGGVFLAANKHADETATTEKATNFSPSPSSNIALVKTSTPPPEPEPPPDPWHGLRPTAVTLDNAKEGSLVYAVGSLTNDTKRQRFGVTVEIEIYDDHKKKLGMATDYVDLIEPGKVWKFRALVAYKKAKYSRLNSVKEQQ